MMMGVLLSSSSEHLNKYLLQRVVFSFPWKPRDAV
jgi:hypothetical protein